MMFEPRNAIVTGSDSGIGRAVAVAPADANMDVGITWSRCRASSSDRFRLAVGAPRRLDEPSGRYAPLIADHLARQERAREHTREHGEDDPAISGWRRQQD